MTQLMGYPTNTEALIMNSYITAPDGHVPFPERFREEAEHENELLNDEKTMHLRSDAKNERVFE